MSTDVNETPQTDAAAVLLAGLGDVTDGYREWVRGVIVRIEQEAAAQPPEGTRLVLVAGDLLDMLGTRNERGNRLTFEWGEPDAHGWYTPVITEHLDDPA